MEYVLLFLFLMMIQGARYLENFGYSVYRRIKTGDRKTGAASGKIENSGKLGQKTRDLPDSCHNTL